MDTPTQSSDKDPRAKPRRELWLSLLRRLTNEIPTWATWKNVDSALAGTGDVDSLAPPSAWPAIREVFVAWADERGYGPVVICPHVRLGPHLITLEPDAPYIVQLDVKERATFRGSTLVDAWNLMPLTTENEDGFRCVRKGADGVIRMLSNGVRPGGRMNAAALVEKNVVALLRADPEGVEAFAEYFGPARDAVVTGARAVAEGEWDRRAMMTVEAWALARSVAEPKLAANRLWFSQVAKKRCPVIQLIRDADRRVPEDPEAWLETVRVDHEVVTTSGG